MGDLERRRRPRARAVAAALGLTAVLAVGGCADDDDDLPDADDPTEGSEVVPGEDGPVG